MGVYIPSLKMPQTCEDCNLESYCSLWVDARRLCGETFTDANSRIEATIRHPDCPLVEVKPHGRLIDADALMKKLNNCMFPSDMVTTRAVSMAVNWLKESPTILEAEEYVRSMLHVYAELKKAAEEGE